MPGKLLLSRKLRCFGKKGVGTRACASLKTQPKGGCGPR
jgi:hypothetical protein